MKYPGAKECDFKMVERGKYPQNYPLGAIVHFTAGNDNPMSTARDGADRGLMFFVIGGNGDVYQAFDLDAWGYHAGQSFWPGLGNGVSRFLVGIEICCAGVLNGNQSWFRTTIPDNQIRTVEAKDNIKKGSYHKYTDAQENSLIELLLWLKEQNPDIFSFDLVLGHDEVSPDRKFDPGGSLSMTMPEFREKLKWLSSLR